MQMTPLLAQFEINTHYSIRSPAAPGTDAKIICLEIHATHYIYVAH